MAFASATSAIRGQTLSCTARGAASRPRVAQRARTVVVQSRVDLTGEWEAVESLASQDDVLRYLKGRAHSYEERMSRLHDVMQTNLIVTSPNAPLDELAPKLAGIEGLPVVDAVGKLVGVISRKDLDKGGVTVKDAMTSPPIALKASSHVAEAATTMLDNKIHRIPVVDDDNVCVGIVTRTDIFWAMAMSDDNEDTRALLGEHGIDM